MTAADLLGLGRRQLMDLLRGGHPIDPRALDDTEYHGVSLGLPGFVEALTWKKFKKTFHRDPATGALRGWNVREEQNGLDAPWIDRRDTAGAPLTFGHYQVVEARSAKVPKGCDRGLLIDYRVDGGAMRRVRDPIVALSPEDPTLLLGWSYLDLGFTHLGTPSFFSLTRGGRLGHVAHAG
jgi:hypothetical protein